MTRMCAHYRRRGNLRRLPRRRAINREAAAGGKSAGGDGVRGRGFVEQEVRERGK